MNGFILFEESCTELVFLLNDDLFDDAIRKKRFLTDLRPRHSMFFVSFSTPRETRLRTQLHFSKEEPSQRANLGPRRTINKMKYENVAADSLRSFLVFSFFDEK